MTSFAPTLSPLKKNAYMPDSLAGEAGVTQRNKPFPNLPVASFSTQVLELIFHMKISFHCKTNFHDNFQMIRRMKRLWAADSLQDCAHEILIVVKFGSTLSPRPLSAAYMSS